MIELQELVKVLFWCNASTLAKRVIGSSCCILSGNMERYYVQCTVHNEIYYLSSPLFWMLHAKWGAPFPLVFFPTFISYIMRVKIHIIRCLILPVHEFLLTQCYI